MDGLNGSAVPAGGLPVIEKIFARYDKDGDGKLSVAGFAWVLPVLAPV